jgi:hypothetical protein
LHAPKLVQDKPGNQREFYRSLLLSFATQYPDHLNRKDCSKRKPKDRDEPIHAPARSASSNASTVCSIAGLSFM